VDHDKHVQGLAGGQRTVKRNRVKFIL
jgi:hypothetical protein